MKIDGTFAVVTGGARGIGRQITRALLARGGKVVFLDVDEIEGRKTEKELREVYGSDHVTFIPCDVTSEADFRDVLAETSSRNGGLDILCNNAGVVDNENWRRMLDVNLTAVIQSTMIGMNLMDSQTQGKGGVITNIASLAGFMPYEFSPVYAASKYGIVGFTRSIAQKAMAKGIRLNLICPTFVSTSMTASITDKAWLEYIQRYGCVTPELVAEGLIKLVEDDSRHGEALRVSVQNGIDFHPFSEENVPV